ncbi:hypothetical protein PtrCC142_012200 [Pyrenophora tritici-repentis]|nr:hypothetical protein PtrSN001A_012161 [Pyrenophora tritici-repentis]KAI1521462.1 hypothetical protein PtrSN001C_012226 [Pyrenophora tritici-repentis]KAI1555710.1 hypothetical protein PtrEW4_012195 [Pyrenophora tritici-repentis]KAI1585240.1 hypothetical protein PtrCC142_012200 [Pyrenophora tritici-repentis]
MLPFQGTVLDGCVDECDINQHPQSEDGPTLSLLGHEYRKDNLPRKVEGEREQRHRVRLVTNRLPGYEAVAYGVAKSADSEQRIAHLKDNGVDVRG